MLREQLRSQSIQTASFRGDQSHRRFMSESTSAKAAGVLLSTLPSESDMNTRSRFIADLWDDTSVSLDHIPSVASAYSAAFDYLGRSGDPHTRNVLLGDLTAARLAKLSAIDKIQVFSHMSQTSNSEAKELDISYDPISFLDNLYTNFDHDLINKQGIFADVIRSRRYFSDPAKFDDVVTKITEFFVKADSPLRKSVGDLMNISDEEMEPEERALAKVKIAGYFVKDTAEAFIDQPESFTKFTDALFEVGYHGSLASLIQDHISTGQLPVISLFEKLRNRRPEAVDELILQLATRGYFVARQSETAVAIAKERGVFEEITQRDQSIGYDQYEQWGSYIAELVARARDAGDTSRADYMETSLLVNERLNQNYTFRNAKIISEKLLEAGDVAGAVRTTIDGGLLPYNLSLDDGVVQVAARKGLGVDAIRAIMVEEHNTNVIYPQTPQQAKEINEEGDRVVNIIIQGKTSVLGDSSPTVVSDADSEIVRNREIGLSLYNKHQAINHVLLALEPMILEGTIDNHYVSSVKQEAYIAFHQLMQQYKEKFPGNDEELEFMASIAMAGGEDEALTFLQSRTADIDQRTYSAGEYIKIRNEIIVAKALKGEKDTVKEAYDLYMDGHETPIGRQRVLHTLLTGALRSGNEHVLTGLFEAIPAYQWANRVIVATQQSSGISPTLSDEALQQLLRGSTEDIERLAALIDPSFLRGKYQAIVS